MRLDRYAHRDAVAAKGRREGKPAIRALNFPGSSPNLSGPTFPRTGNRIVAERCTWTCDKATEVLERERLVDEQNAITSTRETLERDMRRTILRAVRNRFRWCSVGYSKK